MNAPTPLKVVNRDHLKPYKISEKKTMILNSVLNNKGTNLSSEQISRIEDEHSEAH